jgi:hypothetical protein
MLLDNLMVFVYNSRGKAPEERPLRLAGRRSFAVTGGMTDDAGF